MKVERGCRLPGYDYRSRILWRIDFHDPLTAADRVEFCPNSLLTLAPEVVQIVDDALSIEENGGPGKFSGEAPSNLDQWYNGAYSIVQEAKGRAMQEAQSVALAIAEQKKRELEAAQQNAGWAPAGRKVG